MVVVDIGGDRFEVGDARILRMLRAVLARKSRISDLSSGSLQIDFGATGEAIKVRLTEVAKE